MAQGLPVDYFTVAVAREATCLSLLAPARFGPNAFIVVAQPRCTARERSDRRSPERLRGRESEVPFGSSRQPN